MTTTNNIIASGGAPQPSYELRFNPQHFAEDTKSSGKTIGFQEVWQELAAGWFLGAHVVRDESEGVYVRKAFARRMPCKLMEVGRSTFQSAHTML